MNGGTVLPFTYGNRKSPRSCVPGALYFQPGHPCLYIPASVAVFRPGIGFHCGNSNAVAFIIFLHRAVHGGNQGDTAVYPQLIAAQVLSFNIQQIFEQVG